MSHCPKEPLKKSMGDAAFMGSRPTFITPIHPQTGFDLKASFGRIALI